jgi:transforming growth factor-beta-induced protein
MQSTTLFVFIVLSLLQAAVSQPQLVDIVQTAINDGRFKTLVTALGEGDLVQLLKSPGPFTVFAPTDAAFGKLPADTIAALLKPENRRLLDEILAYHVVGGRALTAADIIRMGPPFRLEMLNRFPTNITEIGGKIKINNATVIQADVMASNGIIHAIDTVLFPLDLVETAIADGRFRILTLALAESGLIPALKGTGPFTLFAPTDAAFEKLPAGTIIDLLRPENRPKLIKILTYHVVGGKALTAAKIIALKPPFKLEMLNGISTNITEVGGKIKVNDATVIVADLIGSNGVLHAIDTVLLP